MSIYSCIKVSILRKQSMFLFPRYKIKNILRTETYKKQLIQNFSDFSQIE